MARPSSRPPEPATTTEARTGLVFEAATRTVETAVVRVSHPPAERPAALPTHPTRSEAGPPTGGELEDLRRRLVWLNGARIGVAGLLYGFAHSLSNSGERPSIAIVRWVAITLMGLAALHGVALRRSTALRIAAIFQVIGDLLAWTALVYATGGPASPMAVFYALSALTAAMVFDERAAAFTAMAAIGLYATLGFGVSAGWITLLPDHVKQHPLSALDLTFYPVVNVVAVLMVAVLAGTLANRVARAGGALARAEATRADLAALYEDVLRSIPVALLTCRGDGTIDGANPGAARLFGVPAEAMLDTPVTRWLPAVPAGAFAAGAQPIVGDASLSGDEPRIVAFSAAPLYDRDGRARGGLLVIEDRTAAEAMRESMQRAERLAGLGRLAAALAHEIRNPLGAISGCVELVRGGGGLQSEDHELLTTVATEVRRLNNLVTDMLSFARPRAIVRTPIDLAQLARDVGALATAQENAKVRVVAPSDTTSARVEADAAQLRQVLWNLLRNAMQAAPGTEVELRVEPHDDGVSLVVADRGPGVAENLRDKIFDAFYTGRAQGTGLGLAIVRQIADAHRAAVRVQPREGGGSEFVFTLRRERGESQATSRDPA